MRVRDAAGVDASQEPIYELAPINPLPTIDLSKSVGAELLPVHIDALIFYGMERFKKSLMLASLTSLCMNVAVIVVKESIGQWLSLTSLVLGTPLVAGSICTLRYDIIRLVLRTFEFWSFFIILSLTTLMYTAFVGDLRIPRVLLDWFACLEVVFLDCQVHDLREHVIGVIVAIAPISVMLIWSMLGRIYGGTSFTILAYENHNSHFNLSALDVMGNGLVTLVLLFIKIGYRKREALRSDFNTVRVDCAIIRVGLKMEMISVKKPRSRRQSHDEGIGRSALRTAPTQTISATPPPACPRIIQKFGFDKVNQTFASNQIVFPIRASAGVRIPALRLFILYAVGVTGLLLSCAVIVLEWGPAVSSMSSDQHVQACAWVSLVCTILFAAPFVTLFHRKLLQTLVFSFDFAFYSFQITSANLCVASLYRWNSSHNILMLVWWIWAHWALTTDALTPIMREKLRLRICYAAPVIAILLIIHVAVVASIFFIQNVNLPDVIVWEGTVWKRYVKVSVLPYYFSRVATLLIWCLRLVWRLSRASDVDMTLIRAAASYENCFLDVERDRSRQPLSASSSRLIAMPPRISPAEISQ